jgi:RNA polymerase sigma-70 factor (ECF subfamily)
VEGAIDASGVGRVRLVEEHLSALRAFVHLRLGAKLRSKEESQDLVQSICREVLADLPRFKERPGVGFRDWLFRTAECKILDKARYWNRERRATDREVAIDGVVKPEEEAILLAELASLATPSRDAIAREELERLERAFRDLPDDYRSVIVLSRVHGLPHEVLAQRLGRTVGATRTLLSRALARLALALEEPGTIPPGSRAPATR